MYFQRVGLRLKLQDQVSLTLVVTESLRGTRGHSPTTFLLVKDLCVGNGGNVQSNYGKLSSSATNGSRGDISPEQVQGLSAALERRPAALISRDDLPAFLLVLRGARHVLPLRASGVKPARLRASFQSPRSAAQRQGWSRAGLATCAIIGGGFKQRRLVGRESQSGGVAACSECRNHYDWSSLSG